MKGNIAIADELYKASAISEAPKEITEIFARKRPRVLPDFSRRGA